MRGKFLGNRPLVLILALGVLLRFYKLSERFSWGMDQSLAVWPVVKLFEERKLTLIGVHFMNPKSGLFRPPFFTYLLALPWRLFDFNPLALEVMFALVGILVIGLVYWLAREVFGRKVGWLAALGYAVGTAVIGIDKTVHTITPVIITSVLFLLSVVFFVKERKRRYLFLAGVWAGLGMSFHFQVVVLFLGLIGWLVLAKEDLKEKLVRVVLVVVGFGLLILPLILFNLRHDLVMVKGFRRTFFSSEVIYAQSQSLGMRRDNALVAFKDLCLSLLPVEGWVKGERGVAGLVFLLTIVVPGIVVWQKAKNRQERVFVSFYGLVVLISLVSLAFVNQGFYGNTAFYLWFFIPLLFCVWARVLLVLLTDWRLKVMGGLLLVWLVGLNFRAWMGLGEGTYLRKMALVNYIFNQVQGERFGVKFISTDVLEYDYLFYYVGRRRGMDYGEFDLIEEWNEGEVDFFLIHGDYDFEKDEHGVRPYKKQTSFDGVKVVEKN